MMILRYKRIEKRGNNFYRKYKPKRIQGCQLLWAEERMAILKITKELRLFKTKFDRNLEDPRGYSL